MAYAVELDTTCTEPGCRKRATHEVRNARNEPIRRCCARHAGVLVRVLTQQETAC